MNANRTLFTQRTVVASLTLALALAGCKGNAPAPDDATLNTQVQARLFADQNLSGQAIQASVASGVVTLSGTVSSDSARTIASGDAGQIPGVKTVVNNLVVQPGAPAPAVASAAPAPMPMPMRAPAPAKSKASKPSSFTPAPIVRNTPSPQPMPQPVQAPPPVQQAQAPPPPPPPPMPVERNISLPAGTAIPVRITQTLDSATTQTGDKFTGAVASDIIVDGMVVLPQGTPVTGHVDEAKDAAHFKGSSSLTISLTSISRKGERIQVATDAYTKQGEGRGKNTAEKVGGGAAVGAILGGILGGGKGAAIGAAAGGGVGAGANTVTRGQQVQIPSESVVRFKLSDGILVRVTTGGSSQGNSNPTLERHNDQ
ncbi:MAG TPA: BON domain-containing protein [Acidobacteriaceae bacterium]